MTARVLVSDSLSETAVEIFKRRGIDVTYEPQLGADKAALQSAIGSFDGLAVRSATKVTLKLIEQAVRLRVIGRAGIGVDNIDLGAATARGIIVMNTPYGNAVTTAEHAISMMMALARRIPAADRSTPAGKWE
jgi:D-3-phosphoglycerate dehydrogenase / 2-oxoglutarate reductase